jgi:hypothetical protein
MAVLRRREIERIARTRDVAQTDDFDTHLVAWQWHNADSKDPIVALTEAATRMGGTITQEAADLVMQEAATTRQRRKADQLGQYLRLTDKERSELGIKTIGSIDVNSKQRARRRKEQKRMDDQNRRRMRGAKSRAEYEANSRTRTKPWEKERISRRMWYYRRKKAGAGGDGTSPRTINPTLAIAQVRGQSTLTLKPRAFGTNPRAMGTNPRALGTNPRAKVTKADALTSPPTGIAQVQGQSTVSGLSLDLCNPREKKGDVRAGAYPADTARTEPAVSVVSKVLH